MKILIIVGQYPQVSQTYSKVEIELLSRQHQVEIVSLKPCDYPYRNSKPHIMLNDANRANVRAYLKEFAPDIIHAHYLTHIVQVSNFSEKLGVPFTLRTHSFDVLGQPMDYLQKMAPRVNSDNCLGILAFPFLRERLESSGIRGDKIVDCFPVIDYPQFFDSSPNGNAIMNVGAALPKKNMEDFLHLSARFPDKTFNLYAMGYKVDELVAANQSIGGAVNFVPVVQPDDMPAHYKKHEWLVYTASSKNNTVGWPMAIAEAQAAGVGVCMQNIRPDLKDYVGDAGFLFDSLDEVAEIVSRPFPEALRQRGFELARRSDINQHIGLLTGLWQ